MNLPSELSKVMIVLETQFAIGLQSEDSPVDCVFSVITSLTSSMFSQVFTSLELKPGFFLRILLPWAPSQTVVSLPLSSNLWTYRWDRCSHSPHCHYGCFSHLLQGNLHFWIPYYHYYHPLPFNVVIISLPMLQITLPSELPAGLVTNYFSFLQKVWFLLE